MPSSEDLTPAQIALAEKFLSESYEILRRWKHGNHTVIEAMDLLEALVGRMEEEEEKLHAVQ